MTGKPTVLLPADAMPSENLKETIRDERITEYHNEDSETASDPDTEFSGTEARKKLERRLLFKLHVRMYILAVIYILNHMSYTLRMDHRHAFVC